MKKPLFVLIAVAAISELLAPDSSAQVVVERAAPATFVYPGARVYTYSYYSSPALPAREYVGYGFSDFPYYGRPYGSPSDRWRWPIMDYPSYGTLAHYYYPPLR